MKLPDITILEDDNKILRTKSENVNFPLAKEDLKLIDDSLLYLEMSQIESERSKYNLRAGMGLSFIQLGIPKRIFVLSEEIDEGKFKRYIVINPEIKSRSEEIVYVAETEGCLSINYDVEGIVPRNARITIEAYNEKGKKFNLRLREDMAVAFQHEMDHLDGILFIDKINQKEPYENADLWRAI